MRSRELAVWVGLPIALFLGLGMVSSVNIGIRHLLPLYPFAFVVGGLGLARIAARERFVALLEELADAVPAPWPRRPQPGEAPA